MAKVTYICNLCGKPIRLQEPTNPTNGWLHIEAGSASACHMAWKVAHPEIPDMLRHEGEFDEYNPEGYWKQFYGVPIGKDPESFKAPLTKRDIVIWKH